MNALKEQKPKEKTEYPKKRGKKINDYQPPRPSLHSHSSHSQS